MHPNFHGLFLFTTNPERTPVELDWKSSNPLWKTSSEEKKVKRNLEGFSWKSLGKTERM